MAADVSSLVRMMSGRDLNESPVAAKSAAAPITRDLLGGCCSLDSKELDLDLQVPSGWEKRLDLKSGKVYLQRCNSSNTWPARSESKQRSGSQTASGDLQDLNFPPASRPQPNPFDESSLDLKLVTSSPPPPPPANLYSVCTLERVKSALERAEKEESSRKRSISLSNSSSSPPRSSSNRDHEIDQEIHNSDSSDSSYAAGCPTCLLYVLISRSSPRCPRCNTIVPSPVLDHKKPRIDLNISI